jgi:hypothetical protein
MPRLKQEAKDEWQQYRIFHIRGRRARLQTVLFHANTIADTSLFNAAVNIQEQDSDSNWCININWNQECCNGNANRPRSRGGERAKQTPEAYRRERNLEESLHI